MTRSGKALDVVIYAFAFGAELGVDVELIRLLFCAGTIGIEKYAKPRKDEAFLTAWTRKEAYLKAVGSGLAALLDSFSVPLCPAEPLESGLCSTVLNRRTPTGHFTICGHFANYVGAIAIPATAGD
jgi:phosphopantetheinyl transferase